MRPSKYYTKSRLARRRKNEPPPVLFHFTPRSRAVKILEDGYLRGNPVLSTTENPALISPGPAVFALDSACILAKGHELWPHIWQRTALQEAEWAVVPDGTEELYLLQSDTAVPLECAIYLGLVGRFGVELERILELAEERGIAAGDFDWEEWWGNGPRVPRWSM